MNDAEGYFIYLQPINITPRRILSYVSLALFTVE